MADDKHGHDAHPEPNYIAVFLWLFALTVLEVTLTRMGLPRAQMVIGLVLLAFTKAGLVALYFMHLISERQLLKIIVLVPVIVGTILLIGLVPDALHRILRPA